MYFTHLILIEECRFMKLLIMQFFPIPYNLVTLSPKYLPQHPFLKHPQLMFYPEGDSTSFILVQDNRQNYSSFILTFTPLDNNWEDRRSGPNGPRHSTYFQAYSFDLLVPLPYI